MFWIAGVQALEVGGGVFAFWGNLYCILTGLGGYQKFFFAGLGGGITRGISCGIRIQVIAIHWERNFREEDTEDTPSTPSGGIGGSGTLEKELMT